MTRATWWLAALVFSPLVACTDQGLDGGLETEEEQIVNGKLSSAEDDAVVGLAYNGNGCTGTLIAPTVVLTALHCVTEYSEEFRFSCLPDGSLAPGSTSGQLGPPGKASDVTARVGVQQGDKRVRGKAIFATGSTEACHDDLAVVVLESAPDIGDAPLVSLRFGATKKGERTRAVGYGSVEGTISQVGRQVRTGMAVRGVGGPDADTPGDPQILPRTLQIGEGPCHGDSGGPLFSQETGAEIGVYSILEATTCTGTGVTNTYTQIAPFESLIREALASEGYEPLVEPGETTGAGGEAGAPAVPSGGSTSTGGSDGAGGTENTGDTPGEGAAPSDMPGKGSGTGSYRDSSCSCRVAGSEPRSSWLLASSLLGFAALFSRRRAASGSRRA